MHGVGSPIRGDLKRFSTRWQKCPDSLIGGECLICPGYARRPSLSIYKLQRHLRRFLICPGYARTWLKRPYRFEISVPPTPYPDVRVYRPPPWDHHNHTFRKENKWFGLSYRGVSKTYVDSLAKVSHLPETLIISFFLKKIYGFSSPTGGGSKTYVDSPAKVFSGFGPPIGGDLRRMSTRWQNTPLRPS